MQYYVTKSHLISHHLERQQNKPHQLITIHLHEDTIVCVIKTAQNENEKCEEPTLN